MNESYLSASPYHCSHHWLQAHGSLLGWNSQHRRQRHTAGEWAGGHESGQCSTDDGLAARQPCSGTAHRAIILARRIRVAALQALRCSAPSPCALVLGRLPWRSPRVPSSWPPSTPCMRLQATAWRPVEGLTLLEQARPACLTSCPGAGSLCSCWLCFGRACASTRFAGMQRRYSSDRTGWHPSRLFRPPDLGCCAGRLGRQPSQAWRSCPATPLSLWSSWRNRWSTAAGVSLGWLADASAACALASTPSWPKYVLIGHSSLPAPSQR